MNKTLMEVLKTFVDTDKGVFKKISLTGTYGWYSTTLDFDYLYEHSGDKYISRLVERLLNDNEVLTEANLDKIVNIIKQRYVPKWDKEYSVLMATYNPIHNYDIHEHRGINTNINTVGYNNIHGFNTTSENGVPSEKSGTTTSGDSLNNYEDANRSGNIGVTTTQKLIEEELELRKHNIYEMIMNDVDVVLCNAIYDIER